MRIQKDGLLKYRLRMALEKKLLLASFRMTHRGSVWSEAAMVFEQVLDISLAWFHPGETPGRI